jgi:hemerythrin-like domain-containing protein
MTDLSAEAVAVVETRLTHDLHRRATALLADATVRPSVPLDALAELRDFLIANLRHHHRTEDELLWPRLAAVAPEAAAKLTGLSEEHERLDRALDVLEAVPVAREGDRAAVHDTAVAVRVLVGLHLDHEEPVLFPVLRDLLSPQAWATFAQQVVGTAPPVAPHLLIGLFDEVGTADEVARLLSALPEPAREFVPVLREQGRTALAVLSGSGVPG